MGSVKMPSWKGWNEKEVRQSAEANQVIRFTPINRPISSSFGDSALPSQDQHQHKSSSAAGNGRKHQTRSVVSDYLGRDDETVSVPAITATTRVTRGSVAKKKNAAPKKRAPTTNEQSAPKWRKISDVSDSMSVTKPTNGKAKARTTKRTETDTIAASEIVTSQPVSLFSSATLMGSISIPVPQTSFDAVKASKGYGAMVYSSSPANPRVLDASPLASQPWLEVHGRNSHHDSGAANVARSSRTLSEDFMIGDDDDLDEALAKITETEDGPISKVMTPLDVAPAQRPQTPLAWQWKVNMRQVDQNEDYSGALFSEAEKKILEDLKTKQTTGVKPIVRTPFPRPILDRSPLFGASSGAMLRTCFRIGEALKEGSASARSNSNVVLELYARVTSSHRDGRKQHFVFHDLYHDRPPHLEGVCELWNQTKLWELDTRSFLGAQKQPEGVTCRAIARMKRKEGTDGKGWRLEVLSIWQASGEDIGFIAGIYGKDRNSAAADDED